MDEWRENKKLFRQMAELVRIVKANPEDAEAAALFREADAWLSENPAVAICKKHPRARVGEFSFGERSGRAIFTFSSDWRLADCVWPHMSSLFDRSMLAGIGLVMPDEIGNDKRILVQP
jgi:hypothetical protein